ncbi:RtcB family protein [Dongshaea marina]|uniref:RtcB family protein n=1 Tax=Dongshaea marina TaxID=2047966 RepID=UPI002D767F5B|nr:RtcB family protein [Dongshaea marina]
MLLKKHPKLLKKSQHTRYAKQLGTLGAGNHFIELCQDEQKQLWVLLHSGSRGIGNRIGCYFIELARQQAAEHRLHLTDRDLAYFSEGSESFDDYMQAVQWAQEYARLNRERMMQEILKVLQTELGPFKLSNPAISCHHNFVARETFDGEPLWITRKGAIQAYPGQPGIIPGSMGAKSYIVRGLGNPESFCSCSHGAGRRLSRTAARKQFSLDELERQTRGIECRTDKGVLDEIPTAYKDIDKVMSNQRDLVEIQHTLHQLINIKG